MLDVASYLCIEDDMHISSPLDLREGRDAIQIPSMNTMFNVKKNQPSAMKLNLIAQSWTKSYNLQS